MDITFETSATRILVHLSRIEKYAIVTRKWDGATWTMTVPELIATLRKAKEIQKEAIDK